MKENFAIIVPIYKELDCLERLSLDRLFEINKIGNHKIIFLKNNNLKDYVTEYEDFVYETILVDENHFKDTSSYSYYIESVDFWKLFLDKFEYIYIYQTDCFLLKDNLQEWVDKNFDFIGAPIISTNANWNNVPCTGNGGFSLRKVKKFYKLAEFAKNHENEISSKFKHYEDLYFLQYVGKKIYIDLPNFKDAALFCWDMNPDILYANKFDIPMCVHAWPKNISFWRTKIKAMDNEIIVNTAYNKYKNFIDVYYLKKK